MKRLTKMLMLSAVMLPSVSSCSKPWKPVDEMDEFALKVMEKADELAMEEFEDFFCLIDKIESEECREKFTIDHQIIKASKEFVDMKYGNLRKNEIVKARMYYVEIHTTADKSVYEENPWPKIALDSGIFFLNYNDSIDYSLPENADKKTKYSFKNGVFKTAHFGLFLDPKDATYPYKFAYKQFEYLFDKGWGIKDISSWSAEYAFYDDNN